MDKEIAWNNFYKTGDIHSYLEYTKLKEIGYIENNLLENRIQTNEMENEGNQK